MKIDLPIKKYIARSAFPIVAFFLTALLAATTAYSFTYLIKNSNNAFSVEVAAESGVRFDFRAFEKLGLGVK